MSNLKIIQKPSPNHRKQNGVKKTSITLHWMVGTLSGTDRHFANPKVRVATHYGIAGDKIHQYVDEKDYAFANGHKKANETSISIEHEGGWMLKSGTRKKPTQATHETSAKLVADIAKRHGMGTLEVGKNVFPHKHWVATACPGSLDMEWIVNRANEINSSTPPKAETVKPIMKVTDDNIKAYHVVKPGDSLWKIGKKYGVSVDTLIKLNKIKSRFIFPGQKIKVADYKEEVKQVQKPVVKPAPKPEPKKKTIYTVKSGDSLWKIAMKHSVSVSSLRKLNGIKGSLIHPGQKLIIK